MEMDKQCRQQFSDNFIDVAGLLSENIKQRCSPSRRFPILNQRKTSLAMHPPDVNTGQIFQSYNKTLIALKFG